MKIILANCTIVSGNRGCVALCLSTMYLIDKILSKEGVSYMFYLPQSGHKDYKEYNINIAGKILRYTAIHNISSYTIKSKIKNLINYRELNSTLKIYKEADYIFDIGQGDSFADIYGKNRFDWIFAQYKLGHKYKKKYCVLPQTIGPFENTKIQKQAIKGLEWAKSIMARDKQSLDYVKKLLPDKRIIEILDVAFFLPYQKKLFDKSFIHVGLNISALLWHGGYTRNNQFSLKTDYQSLIKNIIDYFIMQDNIILHLVPHVVDSERNIENDYAVSYEIYEEYNKENLVLAPFFLDPIIAKGYIAGMDFFIGARMHSTIAAFSSGVPVVPMAYSRKFNGLFVDTLKYPHIADMKNEDNNFIINQIKVNFQNRHNLKEIIENRQNTIIKERKDILSNEIKRFLNIK